jgi:HEAT repeat protein
MDYEITADLLLAAIKALGKIGDARAIEPLVEVLGTIPGGWDWRYSEMTAEYNDKEITQIVLGVSAEVLKKLGHEVERGHDVLNNERILIEKLGDDDWNVYLSAAKALGEIGDERAVEPLIGVLSDDDSGASRFAACSQNNHRRVRYTTAEALGKIGDARAVEPLIGVLSDNEQEVRKCAAEALDKIGWVPGTDGQRAAYLIAVEDWESLVEWGGAAVEPLIEALSDENHCRNTLYIRSLRAAAAEALGKIGDARAVEPLIGMLGDEDSDVRYDAAEALGKIGDVRAVEPLIKALEEGNPSAATEALAKITEANIKGKEKENVLRFLESDDPAMVMMGASMLKGILEK